MKTRVLILLVISIVVTAFFTANFFMNLYHFGNYLKIEDGHIWYCIADDHEFCDNTSARVMKLFGPEHCPGLELRKSLGLIDPTARCL